MEPPGNELSPLRRTPWDDQTEELALSCLLADPDRLLPECRGKLTVDHFFSHANRIIFEAMVKSHADGRLDIHTLDQVLREDGEIEAVGGYGKTRGLMTIALSPVEEFAHAMKSLDRFKTRREVIATLSEHLDRAYREREYSADDAAEVVAFGSSLIESQTTHDATKPIAEVMNSAFDKMQAAYERGGAMPGLDTGIGQLNTRTLGMKPADFIVIKAFPGVGKSAFGFQLIRHAIGSGDDDHGAALIMSAEMLADDIGIRLLAAESGVDAMRMMDGSFSGEDAKQLRTAKDRLLQTTLFVDDRPGMNIGTVEAVASKVHREHGLSMILIDYIQLIRNDKEFRNRQESVANISGRCKDLAKKYAVPVIGLSQVNAEGRSREAADIEQDADVVLLIKRNEDAEADLMEQGINLDDLPTKPMTFHLQKARAGKPGKWAMSFRGATLTFEEE